MEGNRLLDCPGIVDVAIVICVILTLFGQIEGQQSRPETNEEEEHGYPPGSESVHATNDTVISSAVKN